MISRIPDSHRRRYPSARRSRPVRTLLIRSGVISRGRSVIYVAFITGELLSDHVLRDFPEPFVLLRKSSAPKDLLAEISRYVTAQRKMKLDLANDQ